MIAIGYIFNYLIYNNGLWLREAHKTLSNFPSLYLNKWKNGPLIRQYYEFSPCIALIDKETGNKNACSHAGKLAT
jgi:hypothetical protein